MSATDPAHPALRRIGSNAGSGSCTGSLGPWLMGGRQGWSTTTGAFRLAPGRTGRLSVAAGKGRLWGTLPRFAWFDAPLVTFTSTFRLRQVGHLLRLTGRGHLIPTTHSPVHARFKIAGTAQLRPEPRQSRTSGRLTLRLTITTTSKPTH